MATPVDDPKAVPPQLSSPGEQLTDKKIEECTLNIRRQIRKLRLDDMASIAQQRQIETGDPIIDERIRWLELCVTNSFHFAGYLVTTWDDVARSFFIADISFFDKLSMVGFAFSTCIVLSVIYIWCAVSNSPFLVWLYSQTLGKDSGGLGLVNAMNPNLFYNLTQAQADAAKEMLSAVPELEGPQTKTFSLDIAKMLLQISSLMYERSNEQTVQAIGSIQRQLIGTAIDTSDTSTSTEAVQNPGKLFGALVGGENMQDIDKEVDNLEQGSWSAINDWTSRYGICFEAVSELASLSQAYASVFWDPRSNWIVVAFKGTDPRSFEEWTTDFTARFENAYEDIPGFSMVHRGFKERIFPSKLRDGQRKPWSSILTAIQIVAGGLRECQKPGTKINVWFTGHSLGTALATLAYSKALISELGENVVLRDAYLFATPITVNMASRHYFNEKIFSNDPGVPRTMWRVTNRNDFVATGLPDLGDNDVLTIDTNNLLGFSHLGIEIFMKSQPRASEVKGNQVKGYGKFDIHIASMFTPDEVIDQRKIAVKNNLTLWWAYGALQYIPIVGRLAAHATVNYYDQLDQIAISQCIDRK